MPNQLITLEMIAREANMVLRNQSVAGEVFNRTHEREFPNRNRGDTIQVIQPHQANIREKTPGVAASASDVNETSHKLTLEKHFYDQKELTQRELTLSLDDFSRRIIQPVMAGIAEQVDQYILGKIAGIPYHWVKEAATPANFASTTDILAARNQANKNKMPMMGRYGIVNPDNETAMLALANVAQADQRGDGGTAFERANIGLVSGINWVMTQNIRRSPAVRPTGWLVDQASAPSRAAGLSKINIDTGSNAPEVGDVFTIAGITGPYAQFVVTEGFAGNEGELGFYPALPEAVADNAALTFVAPHAMDFIGTEYAISYAFAPLEAVTEQSYSAIDEESGISVLVQMESDLNNRARQIAFDVLVGAAATHPEMGLRVCAA